MERNVKVSISSILGLLPDLGCAAVCRFWVWVLTFVDSDIHDTEHLYIAQVRTLI